MAHNMPYCRGDIGRKIDVERQKRGGLLIIIFQSCISLIAHIDRQYYRPNKTTTMIMVVKGK